MTRETTNNEYIGVKILTLNYSLIISYNLLVENKLQSFPHLDWR